MPQQMSHTYDAFTSDKVATILPGDGTAPECRDIILCDHSGELTCIDNEHPAYAPLHYVLLFPHGSNGWSWDMHHCVPPGTDPSFIPSHTTQTQYSVFRMHTRASKYPTLHQSGRLFQQYIVDMWASADQP